jgi:large conductance mechanosensitive channel
VLTILVGAILFALYFWRKFMSMMSEFKEFALKGNVMDLAVGVIIGGAFSGITNSLVEDIIMPIVAFIAGGELNFKNMFILLGDAPEGVAMTYDALKEAGVPLLAYGSFITVLINFLILAFIIFMMVKGMNKMRRKNEVEEVVEETPSEEVLLLREISQKLSK